MNSNGKLSGKVAIVTASTDGIGLAIAKHLGQDGAHVVVSSRKPENVDRAVAELEGLGYSVFGVPCHVSKKDQREALIKKTVEKFGGIDILVSNAAVNPSMGEVSESDCSESVFDKIFEVNVKNALQLTQLVVPHIQKRNGGSIIYVSSLAGYTPFPLLGAYCVSKTALLGLTKIVAEQVGYDNIRVNCLCPGVIDTKFGKALTSNKAVIDKIMEGIPLGRIGKPHELGGIVSFLASEDASYITGESIVAAGGQYSRL